MSDNNIDNNDIVMDAPGEKEDIDQTSDIEIFGPFDEAREVEPDDIAIVFGGDGDDTIRSTFRSAPGSTLFGNTGNDYLISRGRGDVLYGGRGNDTIVDLSGQSFIYGDLGNDSIVARGENSTVYGARNPLFAKPSQEDGKNTLISNGGKNILIGGSQDDSLIGEVGNDTIAGGDGDDTIRGGPAGASFLFGNKGKDFIFSKSQNNPDTLFGGQGDDMIEVTADSTADRPQLFGGVGDDSLMVMGAVNNAILVADVNPDGSFGGSDGDEGNNYLYVDSGQGHRLFGNAGNDTLQLGVNVRASVSMFGGRGDDYIFGGSNASYSELEVFGGKDNDTIIFEGSISQSVIWGDNNFISDGFGDNVIQAGGEGNTLRGGNDNATPENAGSNRITLTSGSNNLLVSGPGGDFLNGSAAGETNTLQGGVGNDTFFFGKNQTLTSKGGANFYRGFAADQGQEVEVTTQDSIAGEANFVVRGDASGFHEIEKGGVRTPDTDKRQNITITVDASGTTRTGAGNDIFQFGSVSGFVTSDAGDNRFTIENDVTEIGAVIGGSGNDIIDIQGAVLSDGSVSGGEGNDSIVANVVKLGAVIDGGQGADTLTVNQLFGKVIGGGEGKNIFNIQTAFGGAEIFTGVGDEQVTLGAVGSNDGDERIFIKGGAGDNTLGLSYRGETTTSTESGSAMSRVEIQGVGGNNIIQGTPFGKDILQGGAGKDLLYGGKSNFNGAKTANELGQIGMKIGDGDQLISGVGRTTFVFAGTQETAQVQSAFDGIEITEAPEGDIETYVLSIANDASSLSEFDNDEANDIYNELKYAFENDGVRSDYDQLDGWDIELTFDGISDALRDNILSQWGNEGEIDPQQDPFTTFLRNLPNDDLVFLKLKEFSDFNVDAITPGFDPDDRAVNFISAGFHVDTLTNFKYEEGVDKGDRIFLNDQEWGRVTPGNMVRFSSAYDGFLFGAIKAFGTIAALNNAVDGNYFNSSFVVGNNEEQNDAFWDADANSSRITGETFLFDETTGGIYLSQDNDSAYLMAVLQNHNIPRNRDITFNSIFEVGDIGQATGNAITLF
ncbi:MAG: calcium-binding protein [Phormidium sp. GEM2.Bin31]|nr:MAG: calcium-binding protein [Phormidium sp. GEM2.Bin31]